MNRNKSLGLTNKRSNNRQPDRNQRDAFDIMRMDPFDEFDSMFDNFDMNMGRGFGNIFSNFRQMSRRFDDMHGDVFSNFESMSRAGNVPGSTVIQKSYVSKVNYNGNGQPQKETYQSQSIKQVDNKGKKIQEKQQAYLNTGTGVQKAAHERRLNDKGHKVIKERNRISGEEMEHTLFKGMNENEYDNFNNEYNEYRNKVNFQKNYEYLNSRKSLPGDSNRRTNNNNQALSGSNHNSNYKSNQKNYKALPDNYIARR